MKMKHHLFLAFVFTLLWTSNTYAYIDPSTTALLTQIVAGIIISLGVTLGVFRQKVMLFFKALKVKLFRKKK
ncbi:MAG: hypothetical protein LBR60_05990 [Fibrobacter sp.]|jgi:hypothetical protein|nr:hypothetical protein [Fibrobacter sp.]